MNTIHTAHSTSLAQIAQTGAIKKAFGWGEVARHFLQNLDAKPATRETYRKALKQFAGWYTARKGAAEPCRADILAYKEYLRTNYSASTVSAYLAAVRGLFGWLEAEKIFPNVAAGIKGAKAQRGFKKDTLTPLQACRMLSAVKGTALDKLRDYALLLTLLYTGMRTIEAARANIEDIRQQGGQAVLYVQGKGRDEKDAFVVLPAKALEAIEVYLARRKEKDATKPLFAAVGNRNAGGRMTTRSISRIVKTSMLAAGIDSDRLTAHSLRHTAVSMALLGGGGLQAVQQMARHSNINTTMIYAHNISRIAEAPELLIEQYMEKFA